jgi:ribosomal peptide maturation radical SAM protein 1
MPWKDLYSPSIQLGILKQLLGAQGIETTIKNYFLSFAEYLMRNGPAIGLRISTNRYREIDEISIRMGIGDWTFAVPPLCNNTEARDQAYRAFLEANGHSRELIDDAFAIRTLVPAFLDACASEILAGEPRVVAFTTVFNQNVPSLALAAILKQRAPELKIVFGGANCEGPMGEGLAKAYPFIDVVVRGEAERVVPALFEDLLAGGEIRPHPGLCIRRAGELTVVGNEGYQQVTMDMVPEPSYDAYFQDLQTMSFAAELDEQVFLPFETARGCWWGAKHHCTFCGLNGATMTFRRKSPERVRTELYHMAERYQRLEFFGVDNILDLGYFQDLLPQLTADGFDIGMFYETKANLSWDRLKIMHGAGILRIQPGIESLSSPILKLMSKGVSALHNIRLLKWGRILGMDIRWNLLYGFPGEDAAEYDKMARILPSLRHLQPPFGLYRIRLDRFSPYHGDPAGHGITIRGPLPHYQHLYDVEPERLEEIAYFFDYDHDDGRNPEEYIVSLKRAHQQWKELYRLRRPRLVYRRGPGFVNIIDQRFLAAREHRYTLEGTEALIYFACEAGATVRQIAHVLGRNGHGAVSSSTIESVLRDLVAARLVYEEEGQYLSLGLPERLDHYPPFLGETAASVPQPGLATAAPEQEPAQILAYTPRM